LRDVYPETKKQRCWKHKIANVLDKLPKRLQAKAKQGLCINWNLTNLESWAPLPCGAGAH